MKRRLNRAVSFLLTMVMLFSLLPTSAWAAGAAKPISEEEWNSGSYYQPDALQGDGWKFSDAVTMTDCDLVYARYEKKEWTGTGYAYKYAYVIALDENSGSKYAIPDYPFGGAPWAKDDTMSEVYIEEGVTRIGDNAFANKNLLTLVEIPQTVTSIGERAFSGDLELRASADGKTPLDLSHVTSFGANAFANCNSLGSTGGVTLNTTSYDFTEIPDGLFTATYLKEIELNDNIMHIGDNAFAHCSLSGMTTIDLPDSLKTIGDGAFTRQTDAPQHTITSLVIPEGVTTIGHHAFYNFTALETVTVLSKNLEKPGEAAFGDSQNNAFHKPGQIQVGDDVFEGTVGTTFLVPEGVNEDYIKMFESGYNCYLGDQSPMKRYPEGDTEANCTTLGRLAYEFTFLGHKDYYYQDTPALGHKWDQEWTHEATCETDKYTYHYCRHEGCDQGFDTTPQIIRTDVDTRTGHNYQYSYTKNPAIVEGKETEFHYICQNENHSDTEDVSPEDYALVLKGKTLQATTLMSLSDLKDALHAVGQGSNNVGVLDWNETDTTTPLTESGYYKVKFTPTNNTQFKGEVVSDGNGTDLTIYVEVSKVTLDFSQMSMYPLTQYVGDNFAPVQAEYMPDVTVGDAQYQPVGGDWSDTAPTLSDGNVGKGFKVRIPFTYNSTVYELPIADMPQMPPSGYTLVKEGGQTWVETAFHIGKNEIMGTVSPILNLRYTGKPQNTVSVTGIPVGSTVTFFVENGSDNWERVGDPIITTTADQIVTGAPMINAGEQQVKVEIRKEYFVPQVVFVTGVIGKQLVETPKAATEKMSFTPISATAAKEFTGVPDSSDDRYTVTGNKGTNADTYTARATLKDPENYAWTTGDNDGDGTAEISWQILKRTVQKPNFSGGTYSYDGDARTAVTVNSAGDYATEYAANGTTLQAIYAPGGVSTGYVAYTATNASQTNAGTYEVTVSLQDSNNYRWPDDSAVTYTAGTWTISQKVIYAPSVTAATITYDGQPYDGAIQLTHSESSSGILELGSNHQYFSGSAPISGTPVNAGSYTVQPELVVTGGLIPGNYKVLNIQRASFRIEKAPLTLIDPTEGLSVSYNGQQQGVPGVTVSGDLFGDDTSADYKVMYTYSYEVNGETMTSQPAEEPPQLKEIGTYTITATLTANDYQAPPVTYEFEITTGTQSITLTPDEESRWTVADETNPAKYTVTLGETENFTVKGVGTVDPTAAIAYEVTEGDAVSIAGASNPSVAVQKAGNATITVKAAATDKVGEATVTYNVVVEKGRAVIERGDISVPYDGSELEPSDYVAKVKKPVDSAPDPTEELTYAFFMDAECSGDSIGTPKDASVYYLKVSYPGDDNYNPSDKVVKVTITAADLQVTAENVDKTYDGAGVTLDNLLTVKDAAGKPLPDATVEFVRSDSEPTDWENNVTEVRNVADSGTYWFKVTAKNHSEYIGSLTVTIKPIDITITPTVTLEKVYDGNADAAITAINGTDYIGAGISLTGTADDENISVTAAAAYNDKTAADGKTITVTYTLTGTGADLANYTFNGEKAVEGKVTGTLTDGEITKKPITVTDGITATDRVYDGTNVVALTGTPTPSGFVSGDNVSFKEISTETGTVTDANVGNNKLVTVTAATLNGLLTGADAGNYTVSDDYTDARVNITARPVYLQFPGQTDPAASWVVEVPYTPAGLTSRPEEYRVSAKAKDDASGFVGEDRLADGDIVYSFVGADNKPEINPTNLGTYTVTAKLSDTVGTKFSNYTIFPVTGKIKIVQNSDDLSVTITPKNNLVYNGQGQDPIQDISVEGGSETLTEGVGYSISYSLKSDGTYDLDGTGLTAAIKDAGSYTVYWKVTTTNYGDQTGSFTVDVERATLDLSRVVDATRTYNGTKDAADQVTGKELTGQQNSESITVSVTGAEYDRATVDASNITITYAITAGGDAKLDNYKVKVGSVEVSNLTGTTGTVTETVTAKITPAHVTVTINNQTAVYDGTKPAVAQEQDTNWMVTDGEIYQLTPDTPDNLGITLSIPGTAEDADTYDITGTASNGNYDVTFVPGDFEITPREVAVTIGSASGIYGDTPNLSSVTLTGTTMVSGESTELFRDLIRTTATNTSDVGKYDITAADGIHGNYNITFTPGTYTVEERPITITIADKSSDYGCDLAELKWDDAYTGDGSKSGIVNGDDLGIVLTTTATNSSPVGSYPITGTASGEKISNYTITWAGSWNQEDANKGTAGTYTIEKANLTIAFTRSTFNVSMGNPVDNPLKYINSSNSNEELSGKPADVTVRYESNNSSVATVNANTGEVTILQPGDATITATVTDGGQNFTNVATASYELRIATAGPGIQVQATPNNHLVYNGAMQQLLEDYTVSPSNASVIFTVTALESRDQCKIDGGMPAALDAGTYRVSWTASLIGYTDVTGWVDVTIDKANPSTGFSSATVQTTYEEDKIFDSTVATTLHVADDYDGSITYLSDNTAVAKVNNNNPTNISINATGTAVIRAQFTETDNYKDQTVSFTLEVTDADTTIQYEADNYEVEYDGRPHGADITVTSPPHCTIWYSDDGGYSYDLAESPAITNVEEGPITIHFQIQAPGYTSVSGTQKVTVKPKEIMPGMISGIAGSYTYTGQDIIVHTLQVADGRTLLDEGRDYEVAYADNREVGPASVTITGKGNYTGSVTVHFEITAVESSYLSASLDRYFGFYGDGDTNSATVTVMHGDHGVTEGVSISVSGADYAVSGQTITFLEPGVYEIDVEVTGSHSGTFTLYYTLLPQSGGDFEITGLEDTIVTYDGEDHAFVPEVSYEGTSLSEADYALTYSYTPFSGSEVEDIYDPASTEMTEAGLYVVTVTGVGSYGGTGTVVLLIAQRDLADSAVDADIPDATYDGSEQEPEVTLTFNGEDVGDLNATEYYYNIDAGEALAVSSAAAGNNNFSGTRVDTFRIDPKELNAYDFMAVADPNEYNYTGSVVTPEVIVTDRFTGDMLMAGRDYTVNSEAVEPGEHTADVVGRGNYTGTVPVDFWILAEIDPPPAAEFDLTVTPESWTYTPVPQADISVTFNGRPVEESGYTLTVERDGSVLLVNGTHAEAVAAILEPGEYAITATGTGVYAGYSDSDTVSVRKIRTAVTVTADPDSLVGGGTVTLTLSGQDLPGDAYLPGLLTVSTENGTQMDLDQLLWVQSGSQWTASFAAADASETYTFTLTYPGDSRYEAASDSTAVVIRPAGEDPGDDEVYIIRASAGTGGSISPRGEVPVAEGDSQRFVITPDDGYEIADVRVDGESIGARSHYTFTDVDDDHTIRAIFEWVGDSDEPDEKPDPKPEPDDNTDDTDDGDSGSSGNTVVDPEDTGVANWLNTTEHVRYLNGYDTGMFMPGANMTRAEVAQMFYNLLLNKNVPITVSFTDVPATAWYADAVNVLASLGILTGYGNSQYAPDRPITRAEFTVIAMRFAQLNPGGVNIFSDVDADDWFYAQVVGSIQYGWITGYADGTFRPNAYITRAEVTAIVNRMLGRVADQAYVDSNTFYLKQFADVSRFYWGYYDIMEATNAHAYSVVNGKEAWLWLQ